jgi:hypothetical protein
LSIGIAGALRFDDAVAWGRVSAGDISNEKGGILQSAHAEVGGLLLIPDGDEEISGSGALKGGGIDENETIVFINHFDDSDEAWDLGLRRRRTAEREFRKPGKGCDQERAFGLWFRRFAGAGVRNFFALRRSSRLGRTAANRQCDQDRSQAQAFQLRRHLGEIAANLGALLVLATPRERLANGAVEEGSLLGPPSGKRCEDRVQRLSAMAAAGSASAGRSVSMSVTAGRGRQDTDAARDDALDRFSSLRVFRKSGVFDTLFEFVPLRGLALLGWNRFVDVSRHKEVMSCGRFMTRIFPAAMHASGVHLPAIGCGFRRLL